MTDLTASCLRTANILSNITDDQLTALTPCENYSVGDVLHHIGGLALAFAAAAQKDFGPLTSTAPTPDGAQLGDDWRTNYPDRLGELARAWKQPDAWQGMTRIAGMEMPGEVVGLIALTEVVIHGWDVARATGQPYDVDTSTLDAVLPYVTAVAAEGPTEGLFGPAVPVADDAPVLDRIVALSGRDPAWPAH
ncbi:MAG TPA: TIGR03086 family metal-binding protein [Mycobacterium sp.]|nr:TIGR03086 family metal-binding protein [Mycobacterium sp.]